MYSMPIKERNMKDLKNVLILDVKTTCWEGKNPDNQINEIIQITVANFNLIEEVRTDLETFYIKPIKSEMSDYCINLHKINMSNYNNAVTLEQACLMLEKKFQSKDKTLFTYGSYPRTIFLKNCKTFSINYPFSANYINLKNMLALSFKLNTELKLDKAIENFNIKKNEEADIWQILEVFKLIFMKKKTLPRVEGK